MRRWKFWMLAVFLLSACENDPTGTGRSREVEISSPSSYIDVGQTLQLSATAKDAAGAALDEARVVWTSSNPLVASVEGGRVTGRSVGTAYVKASAGSASDSVQLFVEAPIAELVVWPADTVRLIAGRKARLVVEMKDDAGRPVPHSLDITSSEPSRVAVRGRELDAVALGAATVTVRAGTRSVQIAAEVVTGARHIETALGAFQAQDLNNLGWVVGSKDGGAVLWRRGVLTELNVGNFKYSQAQLVNDSGTVVGVSGPGYGPGWVLWAWRNGTLRQLPLPVSGDRITFLAASSINDGGEIVGYASVSEERAGRSTEVNYAFYFDGSQVRWIEPGRVLRARAINNNREILVDRFLYRSGVLEAIPQPSPNATAWLGLDLNDKGQYVGFYSYSGWTPYYWDGSRIVDLGTAGLGSGYVLNHINEYGDMVGEYAGASSSGVGGSFLIRRGVVSWVKPTVSHQARAINDLGQILIQPKSSSPDGPEAFLLSPKS